ncbi:MAG TPA: hypothetical protein VFV76_10605 [Actinomycetes bacterium]|nr:hypothetical protein [Actinomycetes bacterium]
MADPVGNIIGDYRGFAAQQHDRLLARGIDIRRYPLSHVAVRVMSAPGTRRNDAPSSRQMRK